MANIKKIPNDLIPAKAGIVRLTPLDDLGRPERTKAVTTQRNFVVSTQHTTTRTSESLPNGNGQDLERATDETHNLTLSTNVYDPDFHSAVASLKTGVEARPVMLDITVVPSASDGTYVFEDTNTYPAAMDDEKYYFEIRDNYGNLLKENPSSPTTYEYKYENSTHTLTFSDDVKGAVLSCVYYVTPTDGVSYEADPVLKTKQYMIEVLAEVQSAETSEMVRYYACMPRGVITGDIPSVTSQKAITNTIAYNFKSAPVPVGVSPFYESFTPIKAAAAAAAVAAQTKKA